MSEQKINFTNINHIARKKLGLSMNEYAVCELIYHLANNPESEHPGWCYAKKTTMGKYLDLSEKSIHVILNHLLEKGYVEKQEVSKHLRVTSEWFNTVYITKAEESSVGLKKGYPKAEESSVEKAEESSVAYNNNIYNKDNNNSTNKLVEETKVSYGNVDINNLSTYFLEKMQLPKEDCTIKQSRRYWHLLLKESRTGVAGVKWLIDMLVQDRFLANNVTSSQDLYYKRMKILTRKRGAGPKVATMPIEGGEENGQTNLAINNRSQSLLSE